MDYDIRYIDDHVVNPVNDGLKITVVDAPGAGHASFEYQIAVPNGPLCRISFQNGTIAEHGINGVTQEALLAVVMDRLRSFQKGPFSCKENACALTHVEEAMHWLQQRTIARMRRGVEGKLVV